MAKGQDLFALLHALADELKSLSFMSKKRDAKGKNPKQTLILYPVVKS
jgi:hypothetical protein